MVYPALLPLMGTPRLPVVDWTDAPRRFKWTRPFRRKTKSGFCACAITFQTQSTKYYECVSVFLPYLSRKQSACAVLYGHLWPVPLYHIFCTLSHKRQDFRGVGVGGGVIEHKMSVLIFSKNFSETFFILRKIRRDVIINARRSARKVPLIFVRF